MMPTVLQDGLPICKVTFEADKLIIELADGRSLSVPLTWYPRLLATTSAERANWHLLGEGYGIE